jgi:hypothetical protein
MNPKLTRVIALALTWLPFLVCLAFVPFLSLTPTTPEEEAEAVAVVEPISLVVGSALSCRSGW